MIQLYEIYGAIRVEANWDSPNDSIWKADAATLKEDGSVWQYTKMHFHADVDFSKKLPCRVFLVQMPRNFIQTAVVANALSILHRRKELGQ